MVRIVERLTDHSDYWSADETKRRMLPVGGEGEGSVAPRKCGGAHVAPARAEWHLHDHFARLIAAGVDQDKVHIAVALSSHRDDAPRECEPAQLVTGAATATRDDSRAGPFKDLGRNNRMNVGWIDGRLGTIGFRTPARNAVVVVARTLRCVNDEANACGCVSRVLRGEEQKSGD